MCARREGACALAWLSQAAPRQEQTRAKVLQASFNCVHSQSREAVTFCFFKKNRQPPHQCVAWQNESSAINRNPLPCLVDAIPGAYHGLLSPKRTLRMRSISVLATAKHSHIRTARKLRGLRRVTAVRASQICNWRLRARAVCLELGKKYLSLPAAVQCYFLFFQQ